MSHVIIFDLETAGLEPRHPTIQLASVVIDETDWLEVASFERKISFNETDADPAALAMNHYDADVWLREAKRPESVAREFAAFAKPYLSIQMVSKSKGTPYQVGKLCAHNAAFDLPRLQGLFAGSFFPFSYHARCTLARAMWFYDEHPDISKPQNLKLATLCESFGIAVSATHEALSDVRLCAALAKAFRDAEKSHWSVPR